MTTASTTTSTTNTASVHTALASLHFDNRSIRELPTGRNGRAGTVFSLVDPTAVKKPHLIAVSSSALALIDLPTPTTDEEREEYANVFSGNRLIDGSQTAAHCYCGYQFGSFAGQLGDGAAIYLGEIVNRSGRRWELQLKGAGLTPYSRSADGRKVLRSSMREFLGSEHMDALGIPTTRSASIVTSDSTVIRDQFYDGRPQRERCTIITRLADTFFRFGSFQIALPMDEYTGRAGPAKGRQDIIRQLIDYTVTNFYPHVTHTSNAENKSATDGVDESKAVSDATAAIRSERDLQWFSEVTERTARLCAQWMSVGFIHGVLNTDNMSISGLTLDYGPYQWMDTFVPFSTSNTSDDQRRYCYIRQPYICQWNIKQLAIAIAPCFNNDDEWKKLGQIAHDTYWTTYRQEYNQLMHNKLGLSVIKEQTAADEQLLCDLFETMAVTGADFTNTFRSLSLIHNSDRAETAFVDVTAQSITAECCSLENLRTHLAPLISSAQFTRLSQMLASNAQMTDSTGIISEETDRMRRRQTLAQLKTQSDKAEYDQRVWREWIEKYRQRIRTDIDYRLSASNTSHVGNDVAAFEHKSLSPEEADKSRRVSMDRCNPRYVLRNWMAQAVIERCEADGDRTEAERLLYILTHPYDEYAGQADPILKPGEACAGLIDYNQSVPERYQSIRVSCSS